MNRTATLLVTTVLLIIITGVARAGDLRTWTDTSGKHRTEAEFLSLRDGQVRLKKKDGIVVTVPIEQLSAADQACAKRQGSSATSMNNATVDQVLTPRLAWPYNPRSYRDKHDDTISCENGIWRVRPTKVGIIWFDFYHAKERKWYVNKNNLNLLTLVEGSTKWQNTELNHVQPSVEIVAEGGEELKLRYHFEFPNGAKIYADMCMRKASPHLEFEVHKTRTSKRIVGFQWHVTFGQAEAVSELHFGRENILVNKLPTPFPGSRLKVQQVQWFRDLRRLEFLFSGEETLKPDPDNPSWMSRVLGLKQRVVWGKSMRQQDHFAFEARDQPWQPDWTVPKTTPWIEGLWFIRNEPFLEGDRLTFGITNLKDYSP